MIYNKAFLNGNFDTFYNMLTQAVPAKLTEIKTKVLPGIDQFLENMLQGYSSIEKTSIDLAFEEGFKGLTLTLVYTVEDFQVPDAPQSAIDADIATLKQGLVFEGLESRDFSIDVNSGALKMVFSMDL